MLIAGATGLIGRAALTHFVSKRDWRAIAISRRVPEDTRGVEHLPLDLRDASACREHRSHLSEVTHLIFAAVSEQPGLVSGWRDRQLMQTNLAMLQNLLDPLSEAAEGLRHVTLLQGAKAYGAHAGCRPPLPAREDAERSEHDNFYWLQEDYLRALAQSRGFTWTIFRPQVVVGTAWGSAMNPLLPLAIYAVLRQEEGKPFGYPGGELQIGEIVDATLLAEAFEWAAASDKARNQTFNVTNGDVFAWREAWPALADCFGVAVGPNEPMSLAEYIPARRALWAKIADRERLRPIGLMELLGESHHYIDLLLRRGADKIQRPMLLSTIKLRRAGFAGCRDSEEVVRRCIAELRSQRLIPPLVRPAAGVSYSE